MATPVILRYDAIAPYSPYHAALVSFEGQRPEFGLTHAQDFFEFMCIVEGQGIHRINGQDVLLEVGQVILVRNTDSHTIGTAPTGNLSFINVAFAADRWLQFIDCAGLRCEYDAWMASPLPPVVSAARDSQLMFQRILVSAQHQASVFDLLRLWAEVVPLFAGRGGSGIVREIEPEWLARSCWIMEDDGALEEGLSRFITESGVSSAHLSRTLKRMRGVTPIEFINSIRLKKAAERLVTTNEGILEIALDCGYGNLSYFYRRFRDQYGETPQTYRQRARRRITPY
jgi:AraC family cel operon transcriptional repressor